MKYYVCVRIGCEVYESQAADAATLASLYRTGKSIVRFGRRYNLKASFTVYEYDGEHTGNKLFSVYNRGKNGNHNLCRHSRIGLYGGMNGRGYNF